MRNCRFLPTPCSNYYLDSIENNGIFKGHILFFKSHHKMQLSLQRWD
ncbi:MAG: membrane protein insertion efficiency factor YidD [Bdellovibrionota bacterium]